MENVKGILSLDQGNFFKKIIEDIKSIGYDLNYQILNAVDYGVPQYRERIFIIGNNKNLKNPFPEPLKKPYLSVKDVINFLKDIPLNPKKIVVNDRIIYNHIASKNVKPTFMKRKYNIPQEIICDYLKEWRNKKKISVKRIDEILGYKHTAGHWFRKDNHSGSIPNPKDWLSLKKILGFDNLYDKEILTFEEAPIQFEQSLRITNWERPSDTITATSPEIHINKNRRLSVRECAILQTFPDSFQFTGSLHKMYMQVGNSVPVLLAKQIARGIKKELHENNI